MTAAQPSVFTRSGAIGFTCILVYINSITTIFLQMNSQTPGSRLHQLMERKEKVLSVLHPPSAALARVMDQAGCEVGFVGTGFTF